MHFLTSNAMLCLLKSCAPVALACRLPRFDVRFNDTHRRMKVHRAANSPIAKYNNRFFTLFIVCPLKNTLLPSFYMYVTVQH